MSFVAVSLVLLTAFVVRIALAGMPRSERVARTTRSPYLPRPLMEFGYWIFGPPVKLCARLGVTPNMVTAASLFVTAGGAVAVGAGRFTLGGWLLLGGFALDAWDGILARSTGTASIRGEFLDATVDRYADLIAFCGLLYYYRDDALPLALAAAAMIGSSLVSYTRAKGEACGVDPDVGWMQRHERAVYMGACVCLSPLVARFLEPGVARPRHHLVIAMLALVAVTSNATAVWRARVVLRGLRNR
ncbi:MAG TPA: CDP-alcohol phosphatidyltransferase family protein [Polyangia bacterium]|nr:CDP-alcohol phosphatidyltransferase family protein [Polyangia bacterium]